MSLFYGSLKGSAKTETTRQGTANSGIETHVRGWNVGIQVYGMVDGMNGKDTFHVYLTSGSNGSKTKKSIGTFTIDDLK